MTKSILPHSLQSSSPSLLKLISRLLTSTIFFIASFVPVTQLTSTYYSTIFLLWKNWGYVGNEKRINDLLSQLVKSTNLTPFRNNPPPTLKHLSIDLPPPGGEFPNEIFNLTQLTHLEVYSTDVFFWPIQVRIRRLRALPPDITKLTALQELDLFAFVIDEGLSEIGNLTSLVSLKVCERGGRCLFSFFAFHCPAPRPRGSNRSWDPG